MSKFLVLYRSPVSAREQMANATLEQAQAGMQAWQAWAESAGPAIVDLGAPLDGDGDVTGFSVLEADSRDSVDELLTDHPHRHTPGASIDVFEFLAIPGMGDRPQLTAFLTSAAILFSSAAVSSVSA